MTRVELTVPEIGLVAGTRAALGVGVGLLLSSRLNNDQRRGAGWALLIVGAATTIPLVAHVFSKRHVVSRRAGTGNGRGHGDRRAHRRMREDH